MYVFAKSPNIQRASELLHTLRSDKSLQFSEYKELLERTHNLLSENSRQSDLYNLGLSVICHVAEKLPSDTFIRQPLYDCIVASRIFLYNTMLSRKHTAFFEAVKMGLFDLFAQSYYTLGTETILTKDQKELFDLFKKHRKLVVSAPTSFGKSRIIEEIILHSNYNNIAIVQPTIALLNETFGRFRKIKALSKYNLINSLTFLNTTFGDSGNIFILTPEKMDLLLDQATGISIDFFVMDEIYKIQDDPDRKQVFTHCLYGLSKQNCDFYLIGPYFEDFSSRFLEKTKAKFKKFSSEVVQRDTLDLSKIKANEEYNIGQERFVKRKSRDINLRDIVSACRGQTLVYVGNIRSVESRAKYLAEEVEQVTHNDLIHYIRDSVAEDWSLVQCLQKRIAFHHSAIPKYIQAEIVDSFNEGLIEIIVCSPTLTEGVNTTAKNVIIYDNVKGTAELSGFDVKNIKGRAGRFLEHFIGNVITLVSLVPEADKEEVEFRYYDDDLLESEENIQVDIQDLSRSNLVQRKEIENNLRASKIPLELVKSNKYIPINQQISLVNHLRKEDSQCNDILFSSNLPKADQLDLILDLCHTFLFNKQDKEDKKFYFPILKSLTKFYVYENPSLKELIAKQTGLETDTKVRHAFKLISHYFEFALPRYLCAFENLFNFVYFQDELNLKYLVTKLEFGYVKNHEIALKEAGVPNDIIGKIADKFTHCESLREIRDTFQRNPNLINKLSPYEQKVFRKYV